jgi:hypothetical protein
MGECDCKAQYVPWNKAKMDYRDAEDACDLQMERRRIAYERVELYECRSSLIVCDACAERVTPNCITVCQGCGGSYCNLCFSSDIEERELTQI